MVGSLRNSTPPGARLVRKLEIVFVDVRVKLSVYSSESISSGLNFRNGAGSRSASGSGTGRTDGIVIGRGRVGSSRRVGVPYGRVGVPYRGCGATRRGSVGWPVIGADSEGEAPAAAGACAGTVAGASRTTAMAIATETSFRTAVEER